MPQWLNCPSCPVPVFKFFPGFEFPSFFWCAVFHQPTKTAGWLHDLSSHPTLPELQTRTLDVKTLGHGLNRRHDLGTAVVGFWKKKGPLQPGCWKWDVWGFALWNIYWYCMTLWWLKSLGMLKRKQLMPRIFLFLKRTQDLDLDRWMRWMFVLCKSTLSKFGHSIWVISRWIRMCSTCIHLWYVSKCWTHVVLEHPIGTCKALVRFVDFSETDEYLR